MEQKGKEMGSFMQYSKIREKWQKNEGREGEKEEKEN